MRAEVTTEDIAVGEWDGHPTVDLCRECGDAVREGFAAEKTHYLPGRPQINGVRCRNVAVTGVDVEHPSYTDDDYRCDLCGATLTDDDA